MSTTGYFVIATKKILKLWLIKKFSSLSKVKMNIYINANIYLLGPLPHLRCTYPLPSWSSTLPDEIAHVPLPDSELCQRHLHIQHFQEISENTPKFSFNSFQNLYPIQSFAAWMTIQKSDKPVCFLSSWNIPAHV